MKAAKQRPMPAAALGLQAHKLQTVLQHNPDMAARTRDGIDVRGFATESASVDFVDKLLAHRTTVNAGALEGAVRSLSCVIHSVMPTKLEMVRYLSNT